MTNDSQFSDKTLRQIERRLNCLGMPEDFAGEPLHLFIHHKAVLWVKWDDKKKLARWQLVPVADGFWQSKFKKEKRKK